MSIHFQQECYGHLVGERIVFSINDGKTTGYLSAKKEWSWNSTLYHTQKLTQITDVNIGANTIKLFKDNTGANLHEFGIGSDILDTPKAQAK